MCNTDGSQASRDDNDGDGFPDADGYLYKGQCVKFYHRLDQWPATPTVASRSEEHTSELQSLMRTSYAVFCLKKKKNTPNTHQHMPSNDIESKPNTKTKI